MKVRSLFLSSIAIALATLAASAMADQQAQIAPVPSASYVSSSVASGRISTQTATYASVNGNGTSLSVGAVQAGATAFGSSYSSPIANNMIGIAAAASGYVNAMAYNVSTGNGAGSASAGGWSDASMAGSASLRLGFGGMLGQVSGVAGIDGGMGNPVRNGTDAHVVAGTSQDGYAGGTYEGHVSLMGNLSGVQSSQGSDSTAYAGGVTFIGGTPSGQTAAVRTANSGVETNASASFVNSYGSSTEGGHTPPPVPVPTATVD